jgi:hypothetical protein
VGVPFKMLVEFLLNPRHGVFDVIAEAPLPQSG